MDSECVAEEMKGERERADEQLLREFNQGKVILIKLVLFKWRACGVNC